MTLEQYLIKNHKDIYLEYQAYMRRKELPKIGATIKTASGGYDSFGSRKLKVKAHVKEGEKSHNEAVWGGDYIVLTDGKEEYLCEQKEWWKELRIIKE